MTTLTSVPPNFWQKICDEDPKFAFEQYVSMYHNCFKPATSPTPYDDGISEQDHRECLRECRERLDKRSTKDVRARAMKKNVDDMLEMGLRFATGNKIKFNEAVAVTIFEEIMKGGGTYPDGLVAISASLACQILLRKLLGNPEEFDSSRAIILAEISAKYGLFSHTCLNLIILLSKKYGSELTLLDGTDLMKEYNKYRDETGVQRLKSRRCANCDKPSEKRSLLKECAGSCLPENKPVYCSKQCQKADWPKHRKWCKFETAEGDEGHDFLQEYMEYTDVEEVPEEIANILKKKKKKQRAR